MLLMPRFQLSIFPSLGFIEKQLLQYFLYHIKAVFSEINSLGQIILAYATLCHSLLRACYV